MSSASSGEVLFPRHRLEALSDGVFAVVMTLLVLDLKLDGVPPHATDAQLLEGLAHVVRPLVGYIFSFALAGVFWVQQHRQLAMTHRSSALHTSVNILFLFFITLLPFSVTVYTRSAANHRVGMVLYFLNISLIGFSLLTSWLVARRSGLVIATVPQRRVRAFTHRLVAMSCGLLGAAAVAAFQPEMAVIGIVVVMVPILRWSKRSTAEPAASPSLATSPSPEITSAP